MLPYQRGAYDAIKRDLWGMEPDGTGLGSYLEPRGKHRKYIPELHRKLGKSTLCSIIASELCRQKENARVFWGAETQRQVSLFLKPIMDEVTADCPERLKPRWYRQDGMWVWPETDAQIIIGGCEDEAKCNRLRGPACDLFIIDEAGQIAMLDYLYGSVVLWMLSRTGGRVILPSTPATTPAHPFTAMCALAEAGDGGWMRQTVYDSAAFPDDVLEELARECGGKDTSQWKREALCQRVIDESRAIVPEFSADGAEDAICRPLCMRCGAHYDKHGEGEACADGGVFVWELDRPAYFDAYVSGDPGWYPDLYALLFAHWDFRRALTVIEDELEFSKPTTEDVADGIKSAEARLWGEHFERMRAERREDADRPYKRVSDVDHQIIYDMRKLHGVDFLPTRKDDADAQINEVRLRVKHRQIAIHPRCKRLRAHLKAGIKTKNGKDWERIDGFGHFDFIAALVYLVRNVDTQRNPYPDLRFELEPGQWVNPKAKAAAMVQVPAQHRDLAKAWPGFSGGRR